MQLHIFCTIFVKKPISVQVCSRHKFHDACNVKEADNNRLWGTSNVVNMVTFKMCRTFPFKICPPFILSVIILA